MNTKTYFEQRYRPDLEKEGKAFFCDGCLIHWPLEDMSADSRYCIYCFGVLGKEAETLPEKKKPKWVPNPKKYPNGNRQKAPDKPPAAKKSVSKPEPLPSDHILQKHDGVLKQKRKGGRPRKKAGAIISKTTLWRRKKEKQGVLL